MKKYMFGDKKNKLTDTERSLISETVSIEGTINSSGAIDVAGLIKGPVYSKEIIIRETGSITGSIEGDHIEIHGSVSGGIQVNGKATIKKSATVVGTLRYEVISVEEGASVYSDLHCTKADQKLVDKISHLKKTMNQSNLSILTPSSAEEYDNPKEETSNIRG